jgi:hypothetical protein
VISTSPVPDNAVIEFRIWEDRVPTADQPLKVYLKSQKILNNGYANLPFKELFPGKWLVDARIQSNLGSWSPTTQFYIEGSRAPTNLKTKLKGVLYCEHRNVNLT